MEDFIEFNFITQKLKKITISSREEFKKIMFTDTIQTRSSNSLTDYQIFFEDVKCTENMNYIKQIIHDFFNGSIPEKRLDFHWQFVREQICFVFDLLYIKTFDSSDFKTISVSFGIELPHSINPDDVARKCAYLFNGKKPKYYLKGGNKLENSKGKEYKGYFLSILNMNF
jgi:hypothetical protein